MIPQSVLDVLAGRSRYAVECCDGFALARELADGAVDIVLADLPYDEATHNNARTNKKGTGGVIDIDFDVLPPVESFLPALLRCSKRWVICMCAMRQLAEYATAAGGTYQDGGAYVRDGFWDRTNGTPQKSADRPAQAGEGIAIMHRQVGRLHWNGGGKRACWSGPVCSDPLRKHPTKKPGYLGGAFLRDFAEPGDIIFDPGCGEGTFIEAAYRLGLRAIGCEIDPEKHQWGVDRMTRAIAGGVQMNLPAKTPRAKQGALFPKEPRSK